MSVHLPLLTTSHQRAYRTCPRLAFFSYELGFRPAYESDAQTFGTLGHRGLEAWWVARGAFPQEPDRWLDAALGDVAQWQTDEYTRAAHVALTVGYHTRWSDEPLVPIAVEHEYTGPLVNPATGMPSRTWRAAGKIDVIARHLVTGDVTVVDHKYTSRSFEPGSDYRQALLLDSQVSNYLGAVRAMGLNPAGWVHDCIKRPGLKPLRATPIEARTYTKEKRDKVGNVTEPSRLYANQREEDESPEEYGARVAEDIAAKPDSYYARIPVVRLEDEEREAAFDYWQTGRQIADSRTANVWPRNTSSCFQYGRACAFLPVCNGTGQLDDPTRYRRAVRPNEELSSGVEKEEGEAAE